MQQEESPAHLCCQNGAGAVQDVPALTSTHAKPFGTASIPGHSAEIEGCCSEVSTAAGRARSAGWGTSGLNIWPRWKGSRASEERAEEISAAAEAGRASA